MFIMLEKYTYLCRGMFLSVTKIAIKSKIAHHEASCAKILFCVPTKRGLSVRVGIPILFAVHGVIAG